MEQLYACQFYIVLGEKEFRPPSDGNVYINATGVLDNNLIKDSIYRAFNKKSSEKVRVANEIIFLVPDESFNVRCQEIISALNIRGKIQILPKGKEEVASSVIEQTTSIADEDLKKEEIQASVITQEVSNEDDSFKDIVDNSPHQTINNSPKIVDIVEYQKRLQDRQNVNFDTADSALEEKNTSTDYSYRAENNANNVFTKEVFNNMGYNSSKEMSKGKSLVRVKKNSAGIVSLPVIIFILSALLLIVSAVLLFIVE